MRAFFSLLSVATVVSMIGLVACSSDSSSSGSSSCDDAAKVADTCNASQADSGTKVTVTFKADQCKSAGDSGKKIADCIVANKAKCACVVTCSLTGACS